MYLKSIKAYGFKSFADKTEINFGENINGIVGPNGSGKSNVVDAVRWVLGEQSIKSLRGDNATDIIFSGSKSRKPLNSASVTLVFDNTDLYLPVQYTEVSVRRVMYRSGENEYYLNHERCRLKDITNLLTDTGADKESFNIISQGKIDEILSTKATDRRAVFESAAGVLKYKKRKEEAIKKLERTNNNIHRVDDILRELENNLIPLEQQSENAKKYLKYREELTNLEVSLIAHDIHLYHYQANELTEKIETLKDEVVQLSNNSSTYDVDILTKKDKIKKIDEEISQNQNLLIEITKSIEKIDANIRVLKERKKYIEDATFESDDKVLTLKESILKLETKIHELQNELQKNKDTLHMLSDLQQSNQQILQEIDRRKRSCNQRLEQINRKKTNLKYKIDYLENTIANHGVPNAVKNIMENQRFEGVHNVIGKLIEMDNQYSLAISTALGGAANYLVVDTREDAKELVYYLKEHKLGRATFFPLDTIKPRMIEEAVRDKISAVDGFVGIASSLVQYQDVYQHIILNQLGNVIVCRDLTSANLLSQFTFHRYKIVTLDGQLVNIGGSITGGSTSTGTNIIASKYELESQRLEYQKLEEEQQELEMKWTSIQKELGEQDKIILEQKDKIVETKAIIGRGQQELEELEQKKEELSRETKDVEAILNHHSDSELENMLTMYYSAIANRDTIATEIEKLQTRKQSLESSVNEIEATLKQSNYYISHKENQLKELELKQNTINLQLDNLLVSLTEEYNMTYDAAIERYKLEIDEDIARSMVKELKGKIKEIGTVNVDATFEYEKVKTRFDFLNGQRQDLRQAEDTLLSIIREMDKVMKERFLTTFELIRTEFKKVFVSMFHGGEAELVLTDPDNVLETGIEIQAVPTGKKLKSLSLLSGGEKTFTAISLLFAILNVRPVPFCLLDEVEAALDDANVESFGNYLYKYRNKTQFILITHKKKTMEFADILYGITMQESGVSKLVSVRLEDIKGYYSQLV